MICSHCKYEHGWSGAVMDVVEGEFGGFFISPIRLVRDDDNSFEAEATTVYGCPKCKLLFID